MEVLQAIKTRRSVRKYLDKPVEREKINECLEAARLAPSACNSQPWHYIVIDDPKVKEAFCKEAFSGVYAMTKWAEKAPVLIAAVSVISSAGRNFIWWIKAFPASNSSCARGTWGLAPAGLGG